MTRQPVRVNVFNASALRIWTGVDVLAAMDTVENYIGRRNGFGRNGYSKRNPIEFFWLKLKLIEVLEIWLKLKLIEKTAKITIFGLKSAFFSGMMKIFF